MRAIAIPKGACRKLDAKCYIQDGLVEIWDGIENVAWGTHSDDISTSGWVGLKQGIVIMPIDTTVTPMVAGRICVHFGGQQGGYYSKNNFFKLAIQDAISANNFSVENVSLAGISVAQSMRMNCTFTNHGGNYFMRYNSDNELEFYSLNYTVSTSGFDTYHSGTYHRYRNIVTLGYDGSLVYNGKTYSRVASNSVNNLMYNDSYYNACCSFSCIPSPDDNLPEEFSPWCNTCNFYMGNGTQKTIEGYVRKPNGNLTYSYVPYGDSFAFCLRLYNRPLTFDEMKYNRSIDCQRFGLNLTI